MLITAPAFFAVAVPAAPLGVWQGPRKGRWFPPSRFCTLVELAWLQAAVGRAQALVALMCGGGGLGLFADFGALPE